MQAAAAGIDEAIAQHGKRTSRLHAPAGGRTDSIAVVGFTTARGRIVAIDLIADGAKLGRLSLDSEAS